MISALTGLFAFIFFCVYMLGMMNAYAALETGVDPKFFPIYKLIRKLTKKPTGFFFLSAGISIFFLLAGGALYELVAPWAGLVFFVALAVYAVFYAYRKLHLKPSA
jgi:uncharacterized membrane protein